MGGRLNQVTSNFPGGSTTITWSKGLPAEVQSDPEAALELLVTTLPAKLNGNLKSNKKISLEGNLGREFTIDGAIESQQIRALIRAYLVHDTFFQINAIFKRGSPGAPANAQRVFDSFKLVR